MKRWRKIPASVYNTGDIYELWEGERQLAEVYRQRTHGNYCFANFVDGSSSGFIFLGPVNAQEKAKESVIAALKKESAE